MPPPFIPLHTPPTLPVVAARPPPWWYLAAGTLVFFQTKDKLAGGNSNPCDGPCLRIQSPAC